MSEQPNDIARILDEAVAIIGPQRNKGLEGPLYSFMRRYGPMFCADVVLVPENFNPSVILAKRNNKGVAPGQYWIFGGRVDKGLDYVKVAETKTKGEIGLDVPLSQSDIIGFGRTYFSPDLNEERQRNHDIATPNICFAKQIPITKEAYDKIHPADGHEQVWNVFEQIESSWHPYIIHAVATAWNRFYPHASWKSSVSEPVRKVLADKSHFAPLRYENIGF